MKLLYVSDVYFPRVNGVSTSIRTFMHELRELGHEVHLLAPAYGEGDREEAGVTRIKAFSVPFDPEDRFMLAGKIRARVDELAAENYDLVHIQTPFVAHRVGKQLARRLDVPVLETYHTYFEEYLNHYVPFSPPGLMRSLARRMTRRQCNDVDAVVVPSHAMREVLEGYGVRSPIEVVPTGLSPADFQSGDGEAFRRRFRIHRQRPTLVHIGRVAFEKNIDFLMRVLRRVAIEVPDVLLVIAGEGPARASLRKQVEKLGIEDNVLFVGYLDRSSDLLDCYRAADLFIFASKTETQGLVLLEAMALSVPVVSTAFLGTRDILGPGKGCLVAEDDEEHFASQVLRLLHDHELRGELRKHARDYALGEWSASVMAERMADLYGRLVGRAEISAAA